MLSSRDQNMTVDLYGPQDPCSLRSRPARSALGEIRKDIQLWSHCVSERNSNTHMFQP